MKNIIIALSMLVLASGCVTDKKVRKYLDKDPQLLKTLCAANFPVKTEYVPGKTDTIRQTVTDTVKVKLDCPPDKDGNVKTLKCPPNTHIIEYINRTDTILRENTAARDLAVTRANTAEAKLTAVEQQLKKEQKTSTTKTYVIIGLIVCILVILWVKR